VPCICRKERPKGLDYDKNVVFFYDNGIRIQNCWRDMIERKVHGVSTPKRYEYVRKHLQIPYHSVSSIIRVHETRICRRGFRGTRVLLMQLIEINVFQIIIPKISVKSVLNPSL